MLENITIREFNGIEDIDFAVEIMQQEKWFNETSIELKNSLDTPATICLMAIKENQRSGLVMATVFRDFAVIANLVVPQTFRRKGIASELLDNMIDRIQAADIETIILESKESEVPFFEKFAFQKSTRVIHFFGEVPPENQHRVTKVAHRDLAVIFNMDKNEIAADRSFYLHKLWQNYPNLTLKYADNDDIQAYLFARIGTGGYISAGPLVDLTAGKAAVALLSSFQEEIGFQPFHTSALASQQKLIRSLIEMGLKPDPESGYRMVLGTYNSLLTNANYLLLGPPISG